MHMYCKFISGASLTLRDLDYVLTPHECLGLFSHAQRSQDVLAQLPRSLSDTLSLSAKKDVHSLLNSLKQQLERGYWVALSSFARRSSLTENQLSAYPQLRHLIEQVKTTQKPTIVKANFQQVTDDVVLERHYHFEPVLPEPDHKLVVEFAGQWPGNAAFLVLPKSGEQIEKIAQPKKDRKKGHRSIVTFENLEPEPRNLYLAVPINSSPLPLKLKLADNIQPVDKDTEKDEWDNVLVPVRPLAYLDGTKDKNKAAELKGGYLYLFWKNKLWREFFITDKGYYQDIDVEYHRQIAASEAEKEQPKILTREPDGFPLAQFWVPYKIMGEVQQGDNGLKVCFSPKQKTFEQIEALEADSEKLGKVSTPLDELGCYSDSKAFSVQEHISDVDSAAIHTVTDDDMPWLSELPTVVRSFDQSNTVITYVDGHNDGFVIRVDVGVMGMTAKMTAYIVDKNSDYQDAVILDLVQGEDHDWQVGIFSGLPSDGEFTLSLVHDEDLDSRQVLFRDVPYSKLFEKPQAISHTEYASSEVDEQTATANGISQEDIETFNELFTSWS